MAVMRKTGRVPPGRRNRPARVLPRPASLVQTSTQPAQAAPLTEETAPAESLRDARVFDAIKTVREGRDSASERLFDLIYGTPLWPNANWAAES